MDSRTQQRSGPPRRLHVVGNAHIDPVWIWDWREGMHEVLQTFGSALQRLDETPDLFFTASSAALYSWVQRTDPAMFDRIVAAVRAGRWIITGGQWVEPDCNLPNGESMCRQFLYGQRYFVEHFGTTATVGYNIDAFGHTASLPQLLAKSGLRAYVMMRPEASEKKLPSSLFLWEGIDGTHIPTYRIPFGYSIGTWSAVGLDLPSERCLRPVVVRDGCEARRVGVQRDRGQRGSFMLVPADELCGEVLRLCGAATVPGRKETAAVPETRRHLAAPPIQPRRVGLERGECRTGALEVLHPG